MICPECNDCKELKNEEEEKFKHRERVNIQLSENRIMFKMLELIFEESCGCLKSFEHYEKEARKTFKELKNG